jgi:hypothetical protein
MKFNKIKNLINKASTWAKKKTCIHKNIEEGWFVQGVRFRECNDCGETEVESHERYPFTKLVNAKYTNHRKR